MPKPFPLPQPFPPRCNPKPPDCTPEPPGSKPLPLPGWPPEGPIDLPGDPRCCPDDTKEWSYTPFFGPKQTVLDTGRCGPDKVNIEINENGSATVTVNGTSYSYSAEDVKNLHVRTDAGDQVQIKDNRPLIDRIADPKPIDVYQA